MTEFTPLVVLRRGDKVLLTLANDSEPEDAATLTDALHEIFPGVLFVVVGGIRQMAVYHDTEEDDQ